MGPEQAEPPTSHQRFGPLLKENGKALKCFKPHSDLIRFAFLKDHSVFYKEQSYL